MDTKQIDAYIQEQAERETTWTKARSQKTPVTTPLISRTHHNLACEIVVSLQDKPTLIYTIEHIIRTAIEALADLQDARKEPKQPSKQGEEMDTKELDAYIKRHAEDENTWTPERAQRIPLLNGTPTRILADRRYSVFAEILANNTTAKITRLFEWLLARCVHANADLIDANKEIEKLEAQLDALKTEHLCGPKTNQAETPQHNRLHTQHIRNLAEALNVNFPLAQAIYEIKTKIAEHDEEIGLICKELNKKK